MIEFRQYKDGEEESILKLYLKVFNKKLSYDDWNWKYNGLYPNNKLIFLAFDDLLCVGHYALMPYRLNAFGKGIEAFISLDSMVHPNYQGKQVFSKLVEYAYNNINCLDRPYVTFLNEKSIKIYTKKFKWKYLGNIPVFCRPLSLNIFKKKYKLLYKILRPFAFLINRFIKNDNSIILEPFDLFTNKIEELSNQKKFYSTNRSKFFLEWRYNATSHKYQKFNILYDKKIIGFCILRDDTKFGIKFIWIMDMLLNENFENKYSAVLNIIALKYEYESDFIVSLLPMRKYAKYFWKARYFKIPSFILPHDFYFCVNKNMYTNDKINNLDNWYMTWSLNDVL